MQYLLRMETLCESALDVRLGLVMINAVPMQCCSKAKRR